MKFKELGSGVVKRNSQRVIGLFIDGVGLDRATRRIKKKVEMTKLIKGVSSGLTPIVARYYTLIPFEDDSRQRAYLDALVKAGLQVVAKRLPPRGVDRQVSISAEMAADIVAFAMGYQNFSNLSLYTPDSATSSSLVKAEEIAEVDKKPAETLKQERIITLVCPNRDTSYAVSLAKEFNVDTITADFGKFNASDMLKSAAKWIDLSDSETIWRE